MEQRLVQSQTQKLVLSPQIRQYLRLLQIPLVQLGDTIEQELAENPALEEIPEETSEETLSSPALQEIKPKDERNAEELRFDETLRSLDQLDESSGNGFYPQDDFSTPETEDQNKKKNYQETLITKKESLFDYLSWQINFLELSEMERRIAEEIIGNLTDDGYLGASLEEISQTSQASLAEVEKVLSMIQTLDPPGIAARNLQETLLLQLERKGEEAGWAKKIVREEFALLEKKHWDPIARHLKAGPEEIRKAAQLISRLDPKPGRTFYGEDPVAVTPDASIFYDDSEEEKLVLEMHEEGLPRLRISPYYRQLLKTPNLDPQSRKFLKEKIQAALDFSRALMQRCSTLQGITEEILRAQPEFFEKGFSHLKPLRLKDIAERVGIHESTVSRAIHGKYLSTPFGTLPYKSFFSSKLERTEGEAESQKSMMEMIRNLIQSEDPKKPLSDQAMTKKLQEEGIHIARRTVAKYRELLKILPTHLRRKR